MCDIDVGNAKIQRSQQFADLCNENRQGEDPRRTRGVVTTKTQDSNNKERQIMKRTHGDQYAVECPACGKVIQNLWDLGDGLHCDAKINCEHCDAVVSVESLWRSGRERI